jgi:hypothetical protein
MQSQIQQEGSLMKFHLTVVIVFLSVVLAACSLSEDITPPPGYQSPTSAPTLGPATQTPLPTWTSEPATATPAPAPSEGAEATSSGADSVTPSAEVSATPSALVVTIKGAVTMNSGSTLPTDLAAALFLYDTSAEQVMQTLTTTVQPDGSYQFTEVPASSSTAYWASVEYSGVTYDSDPAFYVDTKSSYDLPVVLYDSSEDISALTSSQVHVKFDMSSQSVIQVTELYIVINSGSQVLIIASDGTSIPFIQVPQGASDVQYQLASGSAPLLSASKGFALLPGAEKQYGIVAVFTLPYDRSLKFAQPFPLAVSSLTIFIPQGMRLRSDLLTDAGTQNIQDQAYHLYRGDSLAPGSSLSLTLSGKPGASTGLSLSRQTILLIGIGVVGVLLIGLGVYLYLRDRARSRDEEEENEQEVEKDALCDNRESIMDAIITLDDQYKAGGIPQKVYEKRRAELKERLKKLV